MTRNALALLALLMAGCGGATVPTATSSATPALSAAAAATPTPLAGKLTVFAAASLTESFNAIAAEFTKLNPGLVITPNYSGSATLVGQIIQGADADVFASADESNMQKLVDAKLNG